jgi:hypothetical protein
MNATCNFYRFDRRHRANLLLRLNICLLALIAFSLLLPSIKAQQSDASSPISLFNGATLDGWSGDPRFWRVEDGAIVGSTTEEQPAEHNTFLIWQGKKLSDFALGLKFRISNGNSGIQYRSQDLVEFRVHGYQADIDGDHQYIGILYDEGGRGILAQRSQRVEISETGESKVTGATCDERQLLDSIKKDDWNEYVVTAKGNRLTQSINGFVTVDVIDAQTEHSDSHGILALQIHTGPPMTVRFKDIWLRDFGSQNPSVVESPIAATDNAVESNVQISCSPACCDDPCCWPARPRRAFRHRCCCGR